MIILYGSFVVGALAITITLVRAVIAGAAFFLRIGNGFHSALNSLPLNSGEVDDQNSWNWFLSDEPVWRAWGGMLSLFCCPVLIAWIFAGHWEAVVGILLVFLFLFWSIRKLKAETTDSWFQTMIRRGGVQ